MRRSARLSRVLNRPVAPRSSDPAIQRFAVTLVWFAVGVSLWYFWAVRPLWFSVALLSGYAVLTILLVRKFAWQRPFAGGN